jgi:hypothetical protein
MTTTVMSGSTTSSRSAIERNSDRSLEFLANILEESTPRDPVSIILPVDDPDEFEEAIALAASFARDGYDVDLRHVRRGGSGADSVSRTETE